MFGLTSTLARAAEDTQKSSDRILVVLELSGGNDGLNTLVPYARRRLLQAATAASASRQRSSARSTIICGFSGGMAGFERLYKDGKLAIVHGCGYAQPSFSHFTSMAYWHTAAPNSGEEFGWVGRLADALTARWRAQFHRQHRRNAIAGGERQPTTRPSSSTIPSTSCAKGLPEAAAVRACRDTEAHDENASQKFLLDVARSARDASQLVREAWASYKTPVDYGIVPLGLNKIASLIAAACRRGCTTRPIRHNAFDTHVHQADLHARLLTYVSDAVAAFMRDMERIGRADDVSMLMFSEFGRRAAENNSLGTDHGTANLMYVVGKNVSKAATMARHPA